MANRKMANGKLRASGWGLRRWVAAVVFVLVMGVVTNVGVAWWCIHSRGRATGGGVVTAIAPVGLPGKVLWLQWPGFEAFIWPQLGWDKEPIDAAPGAPGSVRAMAGASVIESIQRAGNTGESMYGEFHAAGWPWPALYVDWHDINARAASRGLSPLPRRPDFADELNPLRVPAAWLGTNGNLLPYRPIWFGFIANTALYASLWAVVALLLPAAYARWLRGHRARRARCGECGYDRRGLASAASCPECGHEQRPTPRAAT
jgi:hypothetical protein